MAERVAPIKRVPNRQRHSNNAFLPLPLLPLARPCERYRSRLVSRYDSRVENPARLPDVVLISTRLRYMRHALFKRPVTTKRIWVPPLRPTLTIRCRRFDRFLRRSLLKKPGYVGERAISDENCTIRSLVARSISPKIVENRYSARGGKLFLKDFFLNPFVTYYNRYAFL